VTRSGPLEEFLSYSSRDADLARRLAKDLRALGVDIWLDQWKLNVGEPIVQTIHPDLDAQMRAQVLGSQLHLGGPKAL
jgi:hypothetical protein